MSPGTLHPLASVKALTFDVFGTVVDWRGTVTEELTMRVHRKLAAASDGDASISSGIRARLESLNREDDAQKEPEADGWIARFVAKWRDSYKTFTRSFDPVTMPWRDVDAHHYDSLVALLLEWQLDGLFSPVELASLSLAWHRLTPWEDSVEGLRGLSRLGLTNATLSNGNLVLLRDLADFGDLAFDKLFSAETFGAYKPDPATYQGAVRDLNMQPNEVAMVAAHLPDLQSAKSHGMRTVYIERPREEDWKKDEEGYKQASSFVDLWITEGEGGIGNLVKTLKELKQ